MVPEVKNDLIVDQDEVINLGDPICGKQILPRGLRGRGAPPIQSFNVDHFLPERLKPIWENSKKDDGQAGLRHWPYHFLRPGNDSLDVRDFLNSVKTVKFAIIICDDTCARNT